MTGNTPRRDQPATTKEKAEALADVISRTDGWTTVVTSWVAGDGETYYYVDATCARITAPEIEQPYHIDDISQWNALRNIVQFLIAPLLRGIRDGSHDDHGEGADGSYGSFAEAYRAWTSGKGCRQGIAEHHCTCVYYFPCTKCGGMIRATGDAIPSHRMHGGVCADCHATANDY